jgi:DMATS type aromatic prenyltransferase
MRSLLSSVVMPWGARPLSRTSIWPSDIGSDHSPFEFSVALTPGAPEIRMVVEAQGNASTFRATRDACLRLNESLAGEGADTRSMDEVRDLFLPDVLHARFALWHGITLRPGRMRAKVYLNPQIHGAGRAEALVQTALERLGMANAWSTVVSALPARQLRGDEIKYFALDLEPRETARAKVYLYLDNVTAEDLERLAAIRPKYEGGEVTEFCQTITGSKGPYSTHPPCVYAGFTGSNSTPSDITVQIPIGYHVSDDRVARDRIRNYLRSRGLETDTYERALRALGQRPLEEGAGLHSYVSLRTATNPVRITVYFAADLYASSHRAS